MIVTRYLTGISLLAVCSTVHLYAQEEGVPTPADPETAIESPSDIPIPPPPVVVDPVDVPGVGAARITQT